MFPETCLVYSDDMVNYYISNPKFGNKKWIFWHVSSMGRADSNTFFSYFIFAYLAVGYDTRFGIWFGYVLTAPLFAGGPWADRFMDPKVCGFCPNHRTNAQGTCMLWSTWILRTNEYVFTYHQVCGAFFTIHLCVVASAFVLAKIWVRSPRKSFIIIMKNIMYRIKVSCKHFIFRATWRMYRPRMFSLFRTRNFVIIINWFFLSMLWTVSHY